MSRFEKVKDYYEKGLWQKSQVHDAVIMGWITREEYRIITNEAYDEQDI